MPPKPTEFDRLAVITIQGGGLYGLNLLGQLGYLTENYQIVPAAVAGNSAGSIVAALYWAGYSPWEIRDIFAAMAKSKRLSGLMGPFEPAGPREPPFDLASFRSLKSDVEAFLDGSAATSKWFGGRWYRGLRTAWTARGLWKRIEPHYRSRGCFQGDEFVETIDDLIRNGPLLKGVEGLPAGRPIEFGDVRNLVGRNPGFHAPALFITATNVTGRRLVVFDSIHERYDPVPIAKAVRASAGFPVFFRPVEFKEAEFAGWYSDGGIVSNYPAWIFSKAFRIGLLDSPEYRTLAPRPWVHFGLRLERGPVGPEPLDASPQLFGSSLARLVVGGEARSELEGRLESLVTRSFTLQSPTDKQLPPKSAGIPVPDDLLDIDAVSDPLVREMYRLGREEADTPGTLDYGLPPKAEIEPLLGGLIRRVLQVFGEPDNGRLMFRANVYVQAAQTLYNQYAVHMEPPTPGTEGAQDANNDSDLRFAIGTGLTGLCQIERRPFLCNLGRLSELPSEVLDNLFGMTAEQHHQVRRDRTWMASVPIFDPIASFPRTLSAPVSGDLLHSTAFSTGMAGRTDGAVFGVLNLDASLAYDSLEPKLDPDPAKQGKDVRIEVVLQLMAAVAVEIGERFSQSFARSSATQPR